MAQEPYPANFSAVATVLIRSNRKFLAAREFGLNSILGCRFWLQGGLKAEEREGLLYGERDKVREAEHR